MDGEIQVPEFVHENHVQKVAEERERQRIIKLKIYQSLLKHIAFGATLGVVALAAPTVSQKVKDLAIVAIEHDNKMFDQETQREFEQVEELTGRSVEEIMESGRTK